MSRPRLVDLFCKEGGASMGYHLAGWEVVGVDIEPQPNYPFEFVQADAFTFPLEGFDAAHASPPCKAFTLTGWAFHFGYHADHPNLIPPTRERLEASGLPWVIENVPGAPVRKDVMLCGSQFGLGVRRHRLFEVSWPLFTLMAPCNHPRRVVSPHGHPNRIKGTAREWAEAMGIDWMSTDGLSQAIPPAYTEWLGGQLLASMEAAA